MVNNDENNLSLRLLSADEHIGRTFWLQQDWISKELNSEKSVRKFKKS